jgi:hypothetical protein
MDIRQLYTALNKPLIAINTVASFADNTGKTLVTVSTANLSFFGNNWVIFDSYVYPDVYQVEGVDASQFIIPTPFSSDDAGVNIYNVTEVYAYVADALKYISSLPCADPLSDNYMVAVYYYALHLYTQASPQQLKRDKLEGEHDIEFFQAPQGNKSNYFNIADQYLEGCLSASLMKSVVPTIKTKKAWQNVNS